jgi:cytochrome P450
MTPPHAAGTEDGQETSDDVPPSEAPLPPGPEGLSLLGNTLQLVRDPFAFWDVLAEHGDVVRYDAAGWSFTGILHPDHVERVLVEEPDTFERYLFADRRLDFAPEGLLYTDGEQWRNQRRLMQPAFTMDRIKSYATTMREQIEGMASKWDDGEEVALNQEFSTLTLRILSKALFDVDVDPDAEDEAITGGAREINRRSDASNLSSFLPGWLPTPGNLRYKRAMADYRERVDELIDDRRATDPKGDDLLSILLGAGDGDGLSEREIRDNLITFMFAGHETTSLGLTYTCMLLAQHDDVREKLQAELETVLDGESVDFEHVPRLDYTDRVITEAMRLYPPAYIMFRRATEDAVIGGYNIPAGTVLTLPQFRIHHDERFYDDPETFDPDRWTDEMEADLPEYAYFPFGGGPRHCIGMRFAMLELKLVVATLAQRFDLELVSNPDPEFIPGATLQPADDVRVRIQNR